MRVSWEERCAEHRSELVTTWRLAARGCLASKIVTRIVCHQTLSGWPMRAAMAIAQV